MSLHKTHKAFFREKLGKHKEIRNFSPQMCIQNHPVLTDVFILERQQQFRFSSQQEALSYLRQLRKIADHTSTPSTAAEQDSRLQYCFFAFFLQHCTQKILQKCYASEWNFLHSSSDYFIILLIIAHLNSVPHQMNRQFGFIDKRLCDTYE